MIRVNCSPLPFGVETRAFNQLLRCFTKLFSEIFDHFVQRWTFEPGTWGETNVECCVDFRLRSRLLQVLMAAAFASQVAAIMSAFKDRAHRLYGRQSASAEGPDANR